MNALTPASGSWVGRAILRIEADYQRSADTHLIPLPLPAFAAHGIDLYLKDESTHPTGSLKHRLARSLFLYALCNGWIGEGTTVVEASSGSTAVSEAYFARLLGLPFIAVMPSEHLAREDRADRVLRRPVPFRRPRGRGVRRGARAGRAQRRPLHGPVHLRRARHRLARQQQHRREHVPADGARAASGAGMDRGGRGHRRHQRDHRALRALPLPRHAGCACPIPRARCSAPTTRAATPALTAPGSRIEGIGRPRVEPSFVRTLVDRMMEVPNVESIAAMRALSRAARPQGRALRPAPTSSACWRSRTRCARPGRQGSILSLLCDAGERYLPSYHDAAWVQHTFGDCGAAQRRIDALLAG